MCPWKDEIECSSSCSYFLLSKSGNWNILPLVINMFGPDIFCDGREEEYSEEDNMVQYIKYTANKLDEH